MMISVPFLSFHSCSPWEDHDKVFFVNLLLILFLLLHLSLFLSSQVVILAPRATYLRRGEKTRHRVKRAVFLTLPHNLSTHLLEHLCQDCFISRKSSPLCFTLSDTFSPNNYFVLKRQPLVFGRLEHFYCQNLHSEHPHRRAQSPNLFFLQKEQ